MTDDKPDPRRRRFTVLALLFCLLLIGCSTNAPRPGDSNLSFGRTVTQEERMSLVRIARGLIGTRYRYGGSEPGTGFDCSGLVFYSYRQGGVSVPRTAALQRSFATPVAISQLRPGDLVFFDTSAKGGHVGIYSGNGQFIHAPSSGGRVREEQLDTPYWRKRWLGGGSLLGS